MEIITYPELKNKDEYMMLMRMAFGWPISLGDIDRIIKLDHWFKDSPIGFCAMENEKLTGHVGVLNIPLKTLEGKTETVGGIRAVATNPEFANKGIAGLLMEKAHAYFKQKGYRFSFLSTRRTLIAYAGYKRLGYVEVESMNRIPTVYKIVQSKHGAKKSIKKKLDPNKIYSLFREFVKDKVGFVIRQKDFVKLCSFLKLIDKKKFVQVKKGYIFLQEKSDAMQVQEIVALDRSTYEKLVIKAEQMSKWAVIDHYVYDPVLLEVYKSRGYKFQLRSNHVLMVKSLDGLDYREVFGDSLYMSVLDWF
ncbi:MAG TPA: GNAT family N-acetyltransferase [candidate division Zixibacteria bacterium]